jgi:hypothetical protein
MARNVIRKGIELDKDDVRWFNEQYPEGSLSGILSMLFSKFREVNTHTPSDYAQLAAKALSEELEKR